MQIFFQRKAVSCRVTSQDSMPPLSNEMPMCHALEMLLKLNFFQLMEQHCSCNGIVFWYQSIGQPLMTLKTEMRMRESDEKMLCVQVGIQLREVNKGKLSFKPSWHHTWRVLLYLQMFFLHPLSSEMAAGTIALHSSQKLDLVPLVTSLISIEIFGHIVDRPCDLVLRTHALSY